MQPHHNINTGSSHSVYDRRHRRLRHHFIAAWIRSPLKMGAALPSSRMLAKAMAEQVDTNIKGAVLELGAGTGVVTNALLKAGIGKERLLVIERDKKLYSLLRSLFPQLNVLCADAAELDSVLKNAEIEKVGAIVSSLPFLTMPVDVRRKIQEQMAKTIGNDGMIVQFTYGHKSPISKNEMKRCGLTGKRVKIVLMNVPPAHVWVYKRA